MKEKTTELRTTEEAAPQEKKPGKFRRMMAKFGRRNAIITASVLLIAAAVLVNWLLFANGSKKATGYQGYDNKGTEQSQGSEQTEKTTADAYFSATQVSRQKARDEALEVLKTVVNNESADETVKNEALTGISAIASEIEKEANIESLITAKGFENCVAVLNGDSASIIVSAESLQPAQLAQINAIVYEQTGILPTNITIINK